VHAAVAQLVQLPKADVFRALAAHARPGDDGGALAKLGRPRNSSVSDGLARGDYGELRETVHEVGAAVVEVWLMAVTPHLGGVLEAQQGAVHGFDGGDAGAALAQRLRELRGIPAQSADGAHTGDGHAPHALLAGLRAVGFGGDQLLDALAHLADVAHAAHIVVGNADIEFIFEGEEDFDGIHGIDAQLLEIALDRDRWKGMRLEVAITFSTRWINSSDIAIGLPFQTCSPGPATWEPGAGRLPRSRRYPAWRKARVRREDTG